MWKIWTDVGGTFTDCLAESPTGQRRQTKVLSSGRIKGRVVSVFSNQMIQVSWGNAQSAQNDQFAEGFYDGLAIELLDQNGACLARSTIKSIKKSDLKLSDSFDPDIETKINSFEIVPDCHAPIVAIRMLTRTPYSLPLPDCEIKLGTTRGTNALLTRTGARTAFVTTAGFRDLLRIGDQARPHLFELTIKKPTPLFESSIEVEERILFDGSVEKIPDRHVVRDQLQGLRDQGIESVAICLMHGFRFPQHEIIVGEIARELGFQDVRLSHEVAPLIKIVPRGETTVLDAYLNPVIAKYLDEVASSLSDNSSLQLMTSSGGLVSRSQFSGKDSVLSGPAGGVVGAAEVGKACGFEKIIGFDMGGTSTDVARYDGQFERDYEVVKAGVRIMTPMLAIETVAAGGGSVCEFDGAKLVVGPQSAGSDPGPACYGRGGPLTVTDLNFFLGRIAESRFPFTLDRNAVQLRLNQLCKTLMDHGFKYSPSELAEGFLKIANHNMAAAIRSVSVGKGYDPQAYTMVTFGGAGSQHACAVARLLNIETVIDHPQSSILSAVGIGMAVPTSHAVQSVLRPLADFEIAEFDSIINSVQTESVRRLSGLSKENVVVKPILNLRYMGTESYLSIEADNPASAISIFEIEHQRQFGYRQSRPVEWVAARAESSAEKQALPGIVAADQARVVESNETQKVYFDGSELSAALFDRLELQPGDTVVGPAIVASSLSTTVVDPGWHAQVLSEGSIQLTRTNEDQPTKRTIENKTQHECEATLNPVQLEIFNQHFSSIASQMGLALQKTSVSVNVKERLDFSCAIFTSTGDLVVNAPHIPVHLGAMSETVRNIIERNSDIKLGDVFVTNNPYAGGSHLPDVTVVSPVFVESEIAFWVASRSHHSEIGGKAPGSMPPDATRLSEEGVLIDNFKLIDGGTPRFDELRTVLMSGPYPSRSPDENIADVRAQVAANRAGESELLKLTRQHGRGVVLANMKFIQDAAEKKARNALSNFADGTYTFEDSLDNDATIRVLIQKHADEMRIDFTGTDSVLRGNQNANPAIIASAVMYVMRLLIEDDIPLNEGVMKPISIVLPECFLNPSTGPDASELPAIVGGNVETSQRVVDVLLGALGIAGASQGTMNNWLMGDKDFGYYETIGGGSGATADGDGADAVHVHMTNTRLTDPEVLETRYPVILRESSIRSDSGGAGQHRGGDGMVREVEFKSPLTVSLLTNRRTKQPYAVGKAQPGSAGKNLLVRKSKNADRGESNVGGERNEVGENFEDEEVGNQIARKFIELKSRCQIEVQPGDRLRLETPGGGGFDA